jgi:hypothetical protein
MIPPPPPGYVRAPPPPPPAAFSSRHGAPGPSPPGSAASVPIERVIDDVAVMGFSREEVRGVLRELAARGENVDLNVVLDRLGAR